MQHPLPPKSAVVGFEPSGRSDASVRAALDMLARFQTRVEVVHTVDLPVLESVAGRPDKKAERYAEIQARAWDWMSERVGALAAEVGVADLVVDDVLHVATGHPAATLVERARVHDADVILLGPHERHGFIDFGSTARAVLGSADCNVWMQPAEGRPIHRILAPTDLSEESLGALEAVRDLALGYGASVLALHCYTAPGLAYAAGPGYGSVAMPLYVIEEERKADEQRFQAVVKDFDWKGVAHDLAFEEGNPVDAILGHQSDVDLIAMGSHGRTGLSAVVLGNVAYGVMKEAKVAVLALRHPRRSWLLGS